MPDYTPAKVTIDLAEYEELKTYKKAYFEAEAMKIAKDIYLGTIEILEVLGDARIVERFKTMIINKKIVATFNIAPTSGRVGHTDPNKITLERVI